MRWRWVVVLWAWFGVAMPVAAEDLRVAVGAQVPGAGGDSGGLTIFREDLAREICRRLMARCEISQVRFEAILPGIVAGEFDLGFGSILRTPERERQVAFSRAIWHSSSRLVGRTDQAPDSDLATLHGRRVVAIAGSQQLAYLQRLAGDRRLTVLSAGTISDAFALLRDGRADFALLPVLGAYTMLVGEPGGHYQFYGVPLTADGLGGSVHIALPKARDDLRQAVDQAITDMRDDGSYSRLVRRHFPFSLD
ncbi:transporter substrate-binding domain-containing protein [Azonexus sp.]|jgi:ABC-type amino acid transport substrate-binding protein|uniref:substrate-binding periplasmic protein n=1 Tax=Azonexus sp. TaxID=1872668 RepID=UPI00282DCA5A|nr:transporter substrate-binding domain-containing protein [Azonexus sp.]MDR1994881.1 transporter substrate-binding domain-containing protein [Azonexus sp.]